MPVLGRNTLQEPCNRMRNVSEDHINLFKRRKDTLKRYLVGFETAKKMQPEMRAQGCQLHIVQIMIVN